jgi:hypothetical protein
MPGIKGSLRQGIMEITYCLVGLPVRFSDVWKLPQQYGHLNERPGYHLIAFIKRQWMGAG